MRKEQEVNAYLDAFSELKHELTTAHSSQQAEIRESRHRVNKLNKMAATGDPDQEALAAMRSTLEYKQLQAKNSTDTSVRSAARCFSPKSTRYAVTAWHIYAL